MRWLPRGAFARITLLIAGVVAITVVAAIFLFGRFAAEQHLKAHVDLVDHLTGRVARVLDREGLEGVELLVGEDLHRYGVRIDDAPTGEQAGGRLPRPVVRMLRRELARRLGMGEPRR